MKKRYLIAVAFSLFANLNLGAINVIINKMPYPEHSFRIFFFQLLFSSFFLFVWIFRTGFQPFKTEQIRLYAIRGMISILSIYFFYTSLRMLDPVDAVLLKSTTPFFVPFLAIFWLRERLPLATWPLICLGFWGVYLIIGPFGSHFSIIHFFPLISAVGYAYMIVSINYLLKKDSLRQIILYYNIVGLCFLAPFIFCYWQPMTWELWSIYVILGLLFAFSQIGIIHAYSYSMPGRLAPFIFSEVFFTYLIMQCFFDVHLSKKELLGAAVIFCSALATYYLVTQRGAIEEA